MRKTQSSFLTTLSRGTVLHPALPVDRVTRRKFCMAQDSDDPLFVVNIVVWVLVVVLAIVALFTAHFRVELYGDVPSDVIKVLSAS